LKSVEHNSNSRIAFFSFRISKRILFPVRMFSF
jgi:hypothetical protein